MPSIKSRRRTSGGDERHNPCRQSQRTTSGTRVSPSPARGPTGRVGHLRPADAEPDTEEAPLCTGRREGQAGLEDVRMPSQRRTSTTLAGLVRADDRMGWSQCVSSGVAMA